MFFYFLILSVPLIWYDLFRYFDVNPSSSDPMKMIRCYEALHTCMARPYVRRWNRWRSGTVGLKQINYQTSMWIWSHRKVTFASMYRNLFLSYFFLYLKKWEKQNFKIANIQKWKKKKTLRKHSILNINAFKES